MIDDQIRLFEESKIQEGLTITSAEGCKEALGTIIGFLQDLNIAIEENYVKEITENIFPGSSLKMEGYIPPKDIQSVEIYSRGTVNISNAISNFLLNPSVGSSIISDIDSLIWAVNRYSYDVSSISDEHENSFTDGSQLHSWIKTFNAILGTFNQLIEKIDIHNSKANGTEVRHNPIPIPKLIK